MVNSFNIAMLVGRLFCYQAPGDGGAVAVNHCVNKQTVGGIAESERRGLVAGSNPGAIYLSAVHIRDSHKSTVVRRARQFHGERLSLKW